MDDVRDTVYGPGALAATHNALAASQPSLPRHWYTDSHHWERERQRLWHRSWIYAGRSDNLAQTGDYLALTLAGEPVLLVRGADGRVRGFLNVCRHRGAALCRTDADGTGAGRFSRAGILCPYHAWRYEWTGALGGTGPATPAAGFDPANHGLLPVAVQVLRGCVFVNLDPNAAPPDARFMADLAHLRAWPLEDLVVVHRMARRLACNWKIFWENYMECLHCPGVHPELCQVVPIYRSGRMIAQDSPGWRQAVASGDPARAGGLATGAESWATGGQRVAPRLPGLSDADLAPGMVFATLLPSAFLVGHADYVRAVRLLPLGPTETELSVEYLFHRDAVAAPGFDPQPALDFTGRVMAEDAAVAELNQAGLRASRFAHGTLMAEEYEVLGFQRWVRQRLGVGDDSPPGLAPQS